MFVVIWIFVAWHLLTVKEKKLPKYDVLIHSNEFKCKYDLLNLYFIVVNYFNTSDFFMFTLQFPIFTLALNYLYDDFGAKLSVHLIGPFKTLTNTSQDNISIHMHVGNNPSLIQTFNIERTSNSQYNPDEVTLQYDIGIDKVPQQINVTLKIATTAIDGVPFQLFIDTHALNTELGALCGGTILILLNVLIISEVKFKVKFQICK